MFYVNYKKLTPNIFLSFYHKNAYNIYCNLIKIKTNLLV